MIKKIAIFVFALLTSAVICNATDLPDYKANVADKISGMKLSLDCVIEKPVDADTLKQLAEKAYQENSGKDYKRVFIMWYLPSYKIGNGAWATTNFVDGKMDMSILRLQGE